jgi:hypothetical protein
MCAYGPLEVVRDDGTVVLFEVEEEEPTYREVEIGHFHELGPEAAEQWMADRGEIPVFSGTRQAVDTWIADQCEAEDSYLVPNLLIAGGLLFVLLSLSLGWQRRQPGEGGAGVSGHGKA